MCPPLPLGIVEPLMEKAGQPEDEGLRARQAGGSRPVLPYARRRRSAIAARKIVRQVVAGDGCTLRCRHGQDDRVSVIGKVELPGKIEIVLDTVIGWPIGCAELETVTGV